jgi:hypothetical protein
MKRIAILLLMLILLPTIGCAVKADSDEIIADLGQQVELKIGQTISIKGEPIKVKFIEVVNDSRCAEGATCIWQGIVYCAVEITYLGSVQCETLTQPDFSQASSSDFFKDYSITFSVLPYPKLGIEIKPSEYRLQLMIIKKMS